MSGSELLALGLAALVVLVVAGAIQLIGTIHRRRLAERKPDCDSMARRIGFEVQQQRWVFDTHVARLVGARGDLEIVLELDRSEKLAFTRLWIDFPVPLDINFRILTEADESIWSRLMRMRELEIGAPTFDPHFLLLAHDQERMSRLLDPDTRRIMLDLFNETEFIAIDDDAMTLLLEGEQTEEEVAEFVDLAVRLALRVMRKADEIHNSEQEESEASKTSAFTPVPGDLQAIGQTGGE